MNMIAPSCLPSNLSEITAALEACQENQTSDLNLGLFSDHEVYYQGSLLGQLFKGWSYATRKKITSSLPDVLEHIMYDQFNRYVQELIATDSQLLKLRTKEISQLTSSNEIEIVIEPNNNEDALSKGEIRKKFGSGFLSIVLIWRTFLKDKHQGLRAPLEALILLNRNATIYQGQDYQFLKKRLELINFEGLLQKEIPFSLLSKLLCGIPLGLQENNDLQKWIGSIHEKKKELTPKSFCRVMEEITVILSKHSKKEWTSDQLMSLLLKSGCQVFEWEDEEHLNWRELLQEGSEVRCNGKVLVLGPQLSPQKLIDKQDRYKVFALKDYPDHVLKIAKNRFLLKFDQAQLEKESTHWGFRPAEIIKEMKLINGEVVSGMDQLGRCAIVERLFAPLSEFVWSSTTYKLDDRDASVASVVASHLFCHQDWMTMAQGVLPEHLLFNSKHVLKTMRVHSKVKGHYNDWEQFCVRTARGNRYVLEYLMHVSKLWDHPVANYYRESLSYVFSTGLSNQLVLQVDPEYQRAEYEVHVEALILQAKKLIEFARDVTCTEIRGQKQECFEKDVEPIVKKCLKEKYFKEATPGVLPSVEQWKGTFIEQAINAAKNEFMSSRKGKEKKTEPMQIPDNFSERCSDYEKEMQKIIEYNRYCLTNRQLI